MYLDLAVLAAFVFLYSLVCGGLERTPVSGAIVFTAFGILMGPLGLDILRFGVDPDGLKTLAELTLALVLYTDAANANLHELKRSFRIPQRLLLIGLPLTILFGFGAGLLLFDQLSLIEIAIIATMLAPTDAALGKKFRVSCVDENGLLLAVTRIRSGHSIWLSGNLLRAVPISSGLRISPSLQHGAVLSMLPLLLMCFPGVSWVGGYLVP